MSLETKYTELNYSRKLKLKFIFNVFFVCFDFIYSLTLGDTIKICKCWVDVFLISSEQTWLQHNNLLISIRLQTCLGLWSHLSLFYVFVTPTCYENAELYAHSLLCSVYCGWKWTDYIVLISYFSQLLQTPASQLWSLHVPLLTG